MAKVTIVMNCFYYPPEIYFKIGPKIGSNRTMYFPYNISLFNSHADFMLLDHSDYIDQSSNTVILMLKKHPGYKKSARPSRSSIVGIAN